MGVRIGAKYTSTFLRKPPSNPSPVQMRLVRRLNQGLPAIRGSSLSIEGEVPVFEDRFLPQSFPGRLLPGLHQLREARF